MPRHAPVVEIASLANPIKNDRIYVEVGDIVVDKYRIERVLGEGGMAFVVSARHVKLDEQVALKFLHKAFLGNTDLVERFAREARAASKIKSEHVARVYDVGVLEDGAPFLVMEYLDGKDLEGIVRERGPLPIGEAVEYIMQACEALAVAHSQGIIHRDIKPENLFLVKRDGVSAIKVLDFGISKVALTGKAFELPAKALTGTLTLGTPFYMSPEQIRSTRNADQRSDLWSLGIVLYELLTAKLAFDAENVTELCANVLESDPVPVRTHRPDVPVGLEAVVKRCIEKDPTKRFQNVAEMAIALLPYGPKRARLNAERASLIIKSSFRSQGASDPTLHVPSTMPPPASDRQSEVHIPPTPALAFRPVNLDQPEHVAAGGLSTMKLAAVVVVVFVIVFGAIALTRKGTLEEVGAPTPTAPVQSAPPATTTGAAATAGETPLQAKTPAATPATSAAPPVASIVVSKGKSPPKAPPKGAAPPPPAAPIVPPATPAPPGKPDLGY
jgi:serine/threonine protein kinase